MGSRPYMYSQEGILTALERFIDDYGRLPYNDEMPCNKYGIPIRAVCSKYLGKDWRYLVTIEYVKKHTSWTEEAAKEALLDAFISNEAIHINELGPEHGLPSEMECIYFFGTRWRIYFLALARQKKERQRLCWNKEKIYHAVDMFYRAHGRYPQISEYNKSNELPSIMSIYRYLTKEEFRSINDTLNKLHKYHTAYWTYDDICYGILDFTKGHGRLPKIPDFSNENNLPSWITLKDYLGSDWRKSFDSWVISRCTKSEKKNWTEDSLKQVMVSFYLKNLRLPTDAELVLVDSLPAPTDCSRLLGADWRGCDFLGEHIENVKLKRHRKPSAKWTKESAEVGIGKFIKKYGRFPKNQELLEDSTLPSPFICKKFFGKEWRTILALQFAVDP